MKNLARRIVRSAYAARLRARSRPLVLRREGPLLVLAPHPDDEALGCGALLSERAACGSPTIVGYFTSGEASHRGHSTLAPADVALLRQAEARKAMASIGLPAESLRFCGAPDGRLNALSQDERAAWIERLASLLAETRPAELMLPCRNDGSSEHEAMFELVRRAVAASPGPTPRILEFPIWAWWSPRHLSRVVRDAGAVWRHPAGAYAERKRALLRCYPSQTDPSPPFEDPILPRSFVEAFDTAEEFFFESPLASTPSP